MSESAGSFLSALLDPDAYYPIFIRLCEVLSIAEIIALTRTCKKFQNLYQTLLPLQWNVDRTLQRFVTDPRRFRQEMGKHDALISGGTVLQYFERVVWKESDLDIYVQDGPKAEAMAHYVSKLSVTITITFLAWLLLGHVPDIMKSASPQGLVLYILLLSIFL